MTDNATHYSQGVGGRLGAAKSPTYKRGVGVVEGRANQFVARYMLASDLAYVLTAGELGLTSKEVSGALVRTVLELLPKAEEIDYRDAVADIVVQREAWVIEKLGPAIGGWLHLGRNRGESIRSYLPRLFFRHVLHSERLALLNLLRALVSKSEPVLEALAPQYHHLQHAGVTTLGEYLLSWSSAFYPHLERLEQADKRLDCAPPVMTSRVEVKALADRVSHRLGFSRRARLPREAVWNEDQFAEPFFVLVLVSIDLARLAEDLRLWMTPEFCFFELSDSHASTSSALPQKKNPFGLQAVIGGASIGAGRLAGQLAATVTPSKESDALFHAGSLYQHALDVVAWTDFMADVIAQGSFNTEELRRKVGLGFAGAGEALDKLTFDYGIPFRVSHRALGTLVRALSQGQPLPDLAAFIREETGLSVVLDQEELAAIVRTDIIPQTALDLPVLKETWKDVAHQVDEAGRALPQQSPVESAIAALVEEAGRWLLPFSSKAP